MTIASVLLQTIGPALLPAADAVDFEYYTVLGLEAPKKKGAASIGTLFQTLLRNSSNSSNGASSKVTLADIRKAYKLQSLKWHPDKVAQRRQTFGNDNDHVDNIDATLIYERIQEAATVLQDETQRRLYHDYGCSVARYRFVAVQHGLVHPNALVDNMAAAPFLDKTRLLLVTTCLLLLVWIQPILIATKINHVNHYFTNFNNDYALQDASWLLVLLPTWLVWILYLLAAGFYTVTVCKEYGSSSASSTPSSASASNGDATASTAATPTEKKTRKPMSILTDPHPVLAVLSFLQAVVAGIGIVLLALYWDDRRDAIDDLVGSVSASTAATDIDINVMNAYFVAAPWLLFTVLSILATLYQIHLYKTALACMHSVEYIQSTENISSSDWQSLFPNLDADDNDMDVENEQELLENAALQGVKEKVQDLYIVVHSDPLVVAQVLQAIRDDQEDRRSRRTLGNNEPDDDPTISSATVSPEELETIRVQSSAEFQTVSSLASDLYTQLGQFILIYVPLVLLIAAKLHASTADTTNENDRFKASWWVVFIPLWLRLGLPWLRHFLVCCCSSSVGDHDIEIVEEHDDDGDHENDGKADGTPNGAGSGTATPTSTTTSNVTKTSDGHKTTTTSTETKTTTSTTPSSPRKSATPDDVEWASPEGDISEFNTQHDNADHRDNGYPPLHQSAARTDTHATAATRQPTSTSTSTTTTSAAPTAPKDTESGGKAKPNADSADPNDDDDDDDMPEMDQEAFRQWRQRMEQNEMDEMMETKFKALSSCCGLSFQIMLLCLVVAKLEHDSDNTNSGFNAFWVLFPLLLVSGVVLLCCSCCIYSKPPPPSDETDDVDEHGAAAAATAASTSGHAAGGMAPTAAATTTTTFSSETIVPPQPASNVATSTTASSAAAPTIIPSPPLDSHSSPTAAAVATPATPSATSGVAHPDSTKPLDADVETGDLNDLD